MQQHAEALAREAGAWGLRLAVCSVAMSVPKVRLNVGEDYNPILVGSYLYALFEFEPPLRSTAAVSVSNRDATL